MLALIVAVCCKLYNSGMKVRDYARAEQFYATGDWVQAEHYFSKAGANGWLRYNEETTSRRMAELKHVTEIRTALLTIGADTEEAVKLESYESLLDAFHDYTEKKKQSDASKGMEAAIFSELSAQYKIGDGLTGALRRVEEKAARQLESDMKKKAFADEAAVVLLRLPAGYFGDERKRSEEVRSWLEPYDEARIKALNAGGQSLAALLAEGIRLSKLYEQYGLKSAWLFQQVDRSVQERLAASLGKNDLEAFLRNAKLYEEMKGWPSSGSAATQYIRENYGKQLAAADRLVSERQFAEAIALYEKLAAYRDTRAKIRDAELAWTAAQPDQLLLRAMPGAMFTNVIAGASQFGAVAYAAGITDGADGRAENGGSATGSSYEGAGDGSPDAGSRGENGNGGGAGSQGGSTGGKNGAKLVLVRLMADRTIDMKEADLGTDVTVKELRTVPSLGSKGTPALLVQSSSPIRSSRYIAFDSLQSGLRKLFDFEADGYRLDRPGVLLVENDNGKGAGHQSYYEYRNGQYGFGKVKAD
jgi:hypothetical protein